MFQILIFLVKTVIVYSFPALSLLGLITNTLSFYIFSRKSFKNTIFSIYFRFFLIDQILNLLMPINKMFELNFNLYFSRISNFTCKLRYFYGNVNYSISAWLLVLISFDRYLTISHPVKFLVRKRPILQILACCSIIAFSICFNISSMFFYLKETKTNTTESTNLTQIKIIKRCVTPNFWFQVMKMIQSILTPFLLMIIFTTLTIRNIFKSRQQASCSNRSSSITVQSSKDRKLTISSIANNALFLLFNLPYILLNLINDYTNLFVNLNDLFMIVEAVSFLFLYIDISLTFFINYFVNSMFRKEMKIIFSGKNNKN